MKKKLSKKDLTIITLYKMTRGKKAMVHYEDLLVKTYKSHKKDFQLKKYPNYPDSDVFRYIIYFQLKPQGFIRIAQKQIMMTELGIKECEVLLGTVSYRNTKSDPIMNNEMKRLLNLIGFQMFQNNIIDKIIDQDFFDFYKSSVRTRPLELLGNISQINECIIQYSKKNKKDGSMLSKYSEFLRKRFIHIYDEVKYESNN